MKKLFMKNSNFLFTSFLLFALYSCEYEPKGIYSRELNQDIKAPQLQILNLDLAQDKDTVELLYNRVYFSFMSSNQGIRGVKFYVNDSLIGTVESGNSYFDLNYEFLYAGLSRLKLEVYTSSGTGSIADSLGIENLVFATKEWVIKVNNTSYMGVTSTVSDGFLKLRWPKPGWEISEFVIFRSNEEIGRTSLCEFIVEGHVGERAEYTVRYIDKSQGVGTIGWVGIPNEIHANFSADKDNNYRIKWGELKYWAAVDSIWVLGRDDYHAATESEFTSDIYQNGIMIPGKYFGQLRHHYMVLIPKYPFSAYKRSLSQSSVFSSPLVSFIVGYRSPIYDSFNRISRDEFIYHASMYDNGSRSYQDSMFRYSTIKNKIIERFGYVPPDYSWTGNYFLGPTASSDGSYFIASVGFLERAIVGSAFNFRNYKIVDISKLSPLVRKIPISDNGIGLVECSSQKCLFDFKNSAVISYIDDPVAIDDYNISSDGEYFYYRVSHTIWLYHYAGLPLPLPRTLSGSTFPGMDYFDFVAGENDRAVSWNKDSKEFSIVKCSDLEILKTFAVEEDMILDIDYFEQQILSYSPGVLVVRSLIDGSVLKSIQVGIGLINYNKCRLSGNSLFYDAGVRIFLN
jgi:hypothetical protein